MAILVCCSIIIGVALSNLSYVDLGSSRNQFVLGLSTIMGLMLPHFIREYPTAINTGARTRTHAHTHTHTRTHARARTPDKQTDRH